ncbi:NUDIX hydrolase [Nonomuraea sp. SYSU D8015]|uniref:NUDIX hydrolase n=1 Tax=Nonomuraea sp. SYSU D8015 TaxID=2593644 RepID=UPI00300C2C3F
MNAVVTNEAGDVLLIRRSNDNNWALPGSAIDLGESIPQAASGRPSKRPGSPCEVTGLVGTSSDPRHVIHYNSNGEVRQAFSLVLTARAISGRPTPSTEPREVRWVPRHGLDNYGMHRSMQLRISHYLHGGSAHIAEPATEQCELCELVSFASRRAGPWPVSVARGRRSLRNATCPRHPVTSRAERGIGHPSALYPRFHR